ncbi:hypothetical protein A5906_06365 [Bradyrhizobium sacchari]|uniref:Uncharacterized protein (DUF2147 family) n=1 Tax=Bradyrhizobium sacchari TaxID=1399419 RepID=A0A560KK81_9BRAD|nr:DUF2147 domain-containing protein [Bradyrhizobium sacchari]OPY95611.1 hypothetical protein A5906_06365 [Bradyrhizobium sacchari]TWB66434.1 uncharacterized protein (DUF2147 family) [Bradyrhizobium sacchari]TWB83671.1 uncharacterized protein (DUF2147 family) [Bradyrhizobium sacchari]
MRKLLAAAAFLLLASTAAQAQYTFEYGGRTIRIDPDRGTVQIPGVYDNTGQAKAKKAKKNEASPGQQAPQEAKVDPQPPAAPAPPPAAAAAPPAAVQAPAPVVSAPPPAPPAPPPPATANAASADAAVVPPAAPPAPAPVEQQTAPVVAPPPAAAAVAPPAPPAPAPAPAPVQSAAVAPAPAAAPTRDLNSPLGVWLTEEKEGKVRIEQCGSNLCGYSVDSKSNQNGEQVLINMKPGKDQKWSGRILDPNSGSTYDSTIAMKGTDRLRVQGCAFGGMFCGGQTWTRVN